METEGKRGRGRGRSAGQVSGKNLERLADALHRAAEVAETAGPWRLGRSLGTVRVQVSAMGTCMSGIQAPRRHPEAWGLVFTPTVPSPKHSEPS